MMDIFTQWTNRLPWLALAVAALFLGLFLATSLATGSSKDIEHDSLVLPVRMARRPLPLRSLTFPPPSHHLERPYAHRAALVMLYRHTMNAKRNYTPVPPNAPRTRPPSPLKNSFL